MENNIMNSVGTIALDNELVTDVREDIKKELPENSMITALRVYKKENRFLRYLNLAIKRIIDIIGALVGIIILVPLTIIVAIATLFDKTDKGPIFYTQDRIGKNGKTFKIYKFRTMVVNADEKLFEYLEQNKEAKEEYEKYKKLKNDPRITKIGKFLRNTSLDEWPQFLNVFASQMSLVGPRPYLLREKEEMGAYYDIIIQDKPGITGLWQISGRSDVTFNERINMDLRYNQHNNIIMYIDIILKTALKVLKKEGAV